MKNNSIVIDHLLFKCEKCASCCKDWKGTIYISIGEIESIANHLNLTLEEIFNKFIHFEEEFFIVDNTELKLTYFVVNQINNRCVFLKENNECIIHEVKPFLCKIFPFWSIIMKDKEKFSEYSRKCKGLNRENGIFYDINKIKELLNQEENYLQNINKIALIMNTIDESELLENIFDLIDPDLTMDEDALEYLKKNIIIEKIRILINQNS
ncbi:MAG: YkgJ family cysteine cluster protein [Candidatus Helarchaeota archaeon]